MASAKGKEKALLEDQNPLYDSDSDVVTQAELDDLLEKARASYAEKAAANPPLKRKRSWKPPLTGKLAPLDPGPSLPSPYFSFPDRKVIPPKLIKDPSIDQVKASAPSAPSAPKASELNEAGEPLTRKQKKEQRESTAGPKWFDLPAPRPADIPEMYRQVEALRLRRAMDRKLFMKKDSSEKKGIKALPKYFAMGKVINTPTPFKSHDSRNLTKKERKRTAVDELLADQESRAFAKRRFEELREKKFKKKGGGVEKRARKW